jgi:porphobilinogen synthase
MSTPTINHRGRPPGQQHNPARGNPTTARYLAGRLLTPDDLAAVLLVTAEPATGPVPTSTVGELQALTRRYAAAGIHAVKIFANPVDRTDPTRWAGGDNTLMLSAISEIKSADAAMTIMTETCLCGQTTTGECHLRRSDGTTDTGSSIQAIADQAVAQADAGADIVGPAAMIAGCVPAVREALDSSGRDTTAIMPHMIFSSRLYDGYRNAMGATPVGGSQRPTQISPDRADHALHAAEGFLTEGADMLLLEPALFSVDILVLLHNRWPLVPLFPFSVSGEYTRLTTRGPGNTVDISAHIELATMLKRAGAARIVTYAALTIAEAL